VDDDLDAIVSDCCNTVKKGGRKLECFAVAQAMEFEV